MRESFEPSAVTDLVSVIIPCFNSAAYVVDCLESVGTQRGVNFEIIVVDDGSTDNSLELLSSLQIPFKLVSQPNGGPASARNAGMCAATGRWVKFLDADDFLLPGALRGQLVEAGALGEHFFPVGRSFKLSGKFGIIVPHASQDGAKIPRKMIDDLVFDPPLVTAPLYPREALDDVGGFNENIKFREDHDLFARVILSGWIPSLGTTPVFVYRDHDCE